MLSSFFSCKVLGHITYSREPEKKNCVNLWNSKRHTFFFKFFIVLILSVTIVANDDNDDDNDDDNNPLIHEPLWIFAHVAIIFVDIG